MTDQPNPVPIPPHVRAYIYRLVAALGPILAYAGWVTDSLWVLILGFVSAALGNVQAAAFTSTKK